MVIQKLITKKVAVALIVLIIIVGGVMFFLKQDEKGLISITPTPTSQEKITPSSPPITPPTHEQAELTGFGFIQDFIASAPPDINTDAQSRAYSVLSTSAKERVSQDTISRDLAMFVGVQDVPDQGASVEDLQITSDTQATLIVGLNFSGGRALRAVHLVVEKGEWKVDRVETIDQYPQQ